MKIIIASAGLGNMMFQYALVVAFRERGVPAILFVSEANAHHNGYELENVFPSVNPYQGLSGIRQSYYQLLGKLRKKKLFFRKKTPHRLLFFPFQRVSPEINFFFYPDVFSKPKKNQYFSGAFQSYKYFENCRQELLKEFAFDESKLSEESKEMACRIESTNSVSIHVRRGDYLAPLWYENLGSICSVQYYQRAITEMEKHVKEPCFFVFSDDIDYVRDNLNIPNAVYVNFNHSSNSWQDMYLMSLCKHNIIANSSFSWWGAWLNRNDGKTIIAPKKWWASLDHDDVVPPSWIRI